MESPEEAVQDGEPVRPVNRVTSDYEKVGLQPIHCLSYPLLVPPDAVQMQIAELNKGNTTCGPRCLRIQDVARDLDLALLVQQTPSAACRKPDTKSPNHKLAAAHTLRQFLRRSVHQNLSTRKAPSAWRRMHSQEGTTLCAMLFALCPLPADRFSWQFHDHPRSLALLALCR
jgi:hypothetical protein